MSHVTNINRRIVLAKRPEGMPTLQDFRLEKDSMPTIKEGQILLQTLYLSLDPYMRQMMDEIGPVYASSIPLNQPMPGGTVCRIVTSLHPDFHEGDLVLANAGWQDYSTSDGSDLTLLKTMAQPSQALGILGMPSFTAYVGLLDIGAPKPGETVVVAAATGAVGSIVGQIAKLKGATVVGIAGGPEKCRYAVEELGFDACLDRYSQNFTDQLAAACPKGIDIYFENVGGPVFDAVLPLLTIGARIPVIGHIADYNNDTATSGSNRVPALMAALVQKRIRMQGLVILDHYQDRFEAFQSDMEQWIAAGQIKQREHLVTHLEDAPQAFIDMLQGKNFGKVIIQMEKR